MSTCIPDPTYTCMSRLPSLLSTGWSQERIRAWHKGRRGPVGCTSDSSCGVVGSSPIKGTHCVVEQETLPLLLSNGWFEERIGAWCHNRAKLNWGPYWRYTKNRKQTHLHTNALVIINSSNIMCNIYVMLNPLITLHCWWLQDVQYISGEEWRWMLWTPCTSLPLKPSIILEGCIKNPRVICFFKDTVYNMTPLLFCVSCLRYLLSTYNLLTRLTPYHSTKSTNIPAPTSNTALLTYQLAYTM